MTLQKQWPELAVGDRIVERQKGSTVKTVTAVEPFQYVMARGLNERRIPWRSLRRYRILPTEEQTP